MEFRSLIAVATVGCHRALRRCQQIQQLSKDEWAENRLADFNLWDSGIGASASNRSSLDARLLLRKDAQEIIANLVEVLSAAVEECITIACREPSPVNVVLEPGSSEEVLSPPDSPLPRSLSPWSDDSSIESQPNSYAQHTDSADVTLARCKQDVDSIMDQLVRVALLIRRAGKRSRLDKADRSFRPDDHHELGTLVTSIILSKSIPLSATYTFSFADVDPAKLTIIQSRLVAANKRRRHRFLYAQSHAEALGADRSKDHYNRDENVTEDEVEEEPAVKAQLTSPRNAGKLTHLEASTTKDPIKDNGESLRTGTTASGVTDLVLPHPDATPSQAATTEVSKTIASQVYPKPPRIQEGSLVFRCPCCCQVLPALLREGDRWKKHVAGDLAPYTCVLLNCPSPDTLYATKESWVQHFMNDHRSIEYWVCFACPELPRFDHLDHFIAHTSVQHDDVISKSQIASLEKVSKRSAPTDLESCPICDWPSSEGVRVDAKGIMDHVADHIHVLSLLALPWRQDDSEDAGHARNHYSVTKVQEWLSEIVPRPDTIEQHDGRAVFTQQPASKNHYFDKHEYFEDSVSSSNSSKQNQSASSGARELEKMREEGSLIYSEDENYVPRMGTLTMESQAQVHTHIYGQPDSGGPKISEAIEPELPALSPEFVPELDRFMTHDQVSSHDYFTESQKQAEKFKDTLELFQRTLETRKVDRKYEFEIKEASKYTSEDVLSIVKTVQNKHADIDQVHSCMGRLTKFFRATGRNLSTFERLLAIVPDDVYGPVICGGFTVILGALDWLEKLRIDMFMALDRIPATLSRIHNLLNVHHQSPRLKQSADGILVATFALLEQIVRELSASPAKSILKASFTGTRYGVTIDEAAKSLDEAVKGFELEAKICESQRLSLIDFKAKKTEQEILQRDKDMEVLTTWLDSFLDLLSADKASVDQKIVLAQEGKLDQEQQDQLTSEKFGADVHQMLYRFLTAHPSIDFNTGKLNASEARKRLPTRALSSISTQLESFSTENQKIVKSWTKASGNAHRVAMEDLRQCLSQIDARPSKAEQDRIAYILTSPELRDLLRATEPVLMVAKDTTGEIGEQYSAASYASSMIIFSIQKLAHFPVIYHFCAARGSAPSHRHLSGLSGLYMSLTTQLLQHLNKGPDVELSWLRPTIRLLNNKDCKIRTLRRTFKELVQKLPPEDWLFVVIDSVWKLQSDPDAELEVYELLRLVRADRCRLKLFVTDPFSLRVLDPLIASEEKRQQRVEKKGQPPPKARKIIALEIHHHVESHLSGFNVNWLQDAIAVLIKECSSSSETESSSEDESE